MKFVFLGSRVFVGLIYFIFGLNGFLQFIPLPPLPDQAGQFMGALAATGYFFPVLKATEVIAGLALLTNKFSALALVVLAPITIHIFLFHAVLTPGIGNSLMPVVLIIASLVAAYSMKDKYAPLLKA